jgi:EAL domain-containing protein (putative c-di-GMP-specific phosphodiesterase class I)/CHASE2 domain-containing sensor protein
LRVATKTISEADPKPWKLLLWPAIAGLLLGVLLLSDLEDMLRAARNGLHWHKASGDIVLVKIDNESLHEVGGWPWPRRYHAELVDRLTSAGASRIFFDITFPGATNPRDDQRFADALERSGRVVLAARARGGPRAGLEDSAMPHPLFAKHATIGAIDWQYNFQTAVSRIPYGMAWRGQIMPSFASLLAGRPATDTSGFIADYSIDPQSIPTASASDVLDNKVAPALFRGKKVIIGTASEGLGDQYFVPGTGKMGGAYVHVIAAETLRSSNPVYVGWIPLYMLSLAAAYAAFRQRRNVHQVSILALSALLTFLAPAAFEARNIVFDVMPALIVLTTIAAILTWRQFRARGLVNEGSGLPNLNALRKSGDGRTQAIVAARILNYEEIVATLPPDQERKLVEQIVARLNIGSSNRTLYHGEGGIFAWFAGAAEPVGNHLEALHALFRNPARAGGLPIDLTISFGVELGSGRSLANRLASALVAADEAAHQGLKWKYHDPESLQDASWKLSILSQLDEAIDRGEVWVAFQPKLDIATRRITGAEALARWTHPEKGPIAATEFVAAAEQHDRIGKLTDFVLEKAAAAAAQINRQGVDFEIAVNLSARLLTDKGFTLRLSALLARHGLAPRHLKLELTETAALADAGEGLDMINRLRALGVNIAIDDYGTGQSTLEYLKKIPASEIKIDQSFVKGIVDNRSDRLMVQSTIGLAHSLGRTVVAEGVEHRAILDVLVELGCDVAQGFAIGRPMSLESLARRVSAAARRTAA